MDHLKLTPAERERIAMLAEECGEVVQVVGKILRHGYESYHPDDPSTTNRDLLKKEVTDVLAVLLMMRDDVDQATPDEIIQAAYKKLKYAHHQPGLFK